MQEDIEKEGLSYRYLFLFSLPSLFATLLEPLASIVDNAFAGNKETELFAAVAIGSTIVTSFAWIFNFLTHVPTQRISRSYSKGDHKGVVENFHSALFLALALGLFCSIFIFLFEKQILTFTNTPKELMQQASDYLNIRLMAVPLILCFTVLLSLLRGIKQLNFVFILLFIVTALNILFSYLFLYQFDWGAKGIAAGTVLAHGIGLIIAIIKIVAFEKIPIALSLKDFNRTTFKELGVDGLNMFGRTAFLTLSFYLLTRTAAGIGTESLAAYQLGLQGWLFSSFFIDGFAMTGNILTADYYSNQQWQKLKQLQSRLGHLCLLLGGIICFGLLGFKNYFFEFFSNDTALFDLLEQSWWIVCLAQIPLSYGYLMDGHLFGLGAYAYLRKHMIIGFCLTIIPMMILPSFVQVELVYLWLSLLGLGLYRFYSGHRYWVNFLKDNQKEQIA